MCIKVLPNTHRNGNFKFFAKNLLLWFVGGKKKQVTGVENS